MCFVGERRATARVAPTQKSRSAYKRVVEDADPYEKTRAALRVGVLMLTGPLHESGDQQENGAYSLEDKPNKNGLGNNKGRTDNNKA